MEKAMQLYKKRLGTGAHHARLSPGSRINGQEVSGAVGKAHVLRPGNTVFCYEEDLGTPAHRKQFNLVEAAVPIDDAGPTEDKQEELRPVEYQLARRGERGGYWNVINPEFPTKPMNEKALRKPEAIALLEDLTGKPYVEKDAE